MPAKKPRDYGITPHLASNHLEYVQEAIKRNLLGDIYQGKLPRVCRRQDL